MSRSVSKSGCIALCCIGCLLGHLRTDASPPHAFVNFETPPTHPIALGPDGSTLAVCNLPDGRIELFDVATGIPSPLGSVPVGIDPVSLRFRTANELWVVNHISSSISIVDVSKRMVAATFDTLPGPADVVFAGPPLRAFVSCARVNTLQVLDPVTHAAVTNLLLEGERPKAMSVSPDGRRVYVAIFESGNASTLLASPPTALDVFPEPGPVSDPSGPYLGQNPPPNRGSAFGPPLNPSIKPGELPPLVSHIVKKNATGRWMDDNSRDWTEFISGTNASLSGRIQGWDMPDHDVAVVDTINLSVRYICGLMNICMDVAVNPASGKVAVVGTDGTNERRFEPNLRSTFLRVKVALVEPATFIKSIHDLNPHLDYTAFSLPQNERDRSLGDPRGIVWSGDGERGYVTGMGSRNLVVIDAGGNRLRPDPIELGEGPTGLALDEARHRLYILNRFSATVSVVDTVANAVLTSVPFFDPTPVEIKAGRRHFYDTRRNSGLGQAACASCHLDARMDRLAWDLGDPSGEFLTITNFDTFFSPPVPFTRNYHPMKGPMVTLTLQDIIGHEPFHWRGDRESIEQFNQTFPALLGRDTRLTTVEMAELKAFLASIHFPPNPFRKLDDTLPESVPLPGLYGAVDKTTPLGNGDPARGKRIVFNPKHGDYQCLACHVPPTGLGRDYGHRRGPDDAHHFDLAGNQRTSFLDFKVPQLRNVFEKIGADFSKTNSRAGFGFMHDGRADTLSGFLHTLFPFLFRFFPDEATTPSVDRNIADMIAFLFCFSATDPKAGFNLPDYVARSLDVAAGTGKQLTLTASNPAPRLLDFLSLANSPSNRLDLVVRGAQDDIPRGWYFAGNFVSDRAGETWSAAALLALAAPDNPLTFTLVPRGCGRRLGIDRDGDGWPDRTELEAGFDPADAASHGPNTPPRLTLPTSYIPAHVGASIAFTGAATDGDAPEQRLRFEVVTGLPAGASFDPESGAFQWVLPPWLLSRQQFRMYVRVTDDGIPPLSDVQPITLEAVPLRLEVPELVDALSHAYDLRWDMIPGVSYHLESKSDLSVPTWREVLVLQGGDGIHYGYIQGQSNKLFRLRVGQ